MPNSNDTLPDNLKSLLSHLSTAQAMPLGVMSDIPFLAIKIPDEALFQESITSELKAAVLNIDFDNSTLAVCFVQFRLNGAREYTYTAIYDLSNAKQYNDCHTLLNMEKHGLLIATENSHDFMAFNTNFEAEFNPRDIIALAKTRATEYKPEEFAGIIHAFNTQVNSETNLWDELGRIAPLEQQWYVRIRMGLQPTGS
ncbi:MAG: hypothetical protein U9Q62_11010 [Campylobacterota bacterium]|nr:hypothetical protein [Campylobacterota bacterium]